MLSPPLAHPPAGGGRAEHILIMYSVYALVSESSRKIYVGQTVNLELRLKQHNNEVEHVGNYTRQNKGPWRLIYKEEYKTRSEAIKREKQLKSFRGREFIKKFI